LNFVEKEEKGSRNIAPSRIFIEYLALKNG
jgi:hypothetical protein